MKAIRVHHFGGPEVLKLEEIADPVLGVGEVLLRVKAAGVNPYHTYMRAGAYRARVQLAQANPGEKVLIHVASGGVGSAALQWARAAGMRILATAGSEKGLEQVKAEDANYVFDHRLSKYQDEILAATDGQGVDVILEMLANVNLGNDLKLLARRGRVIVIGSRGDVQITPRELMAREAPGVGMGLWDKTEEGKGAIHCALQTGL